MISNYPYPLVAAEIDLRGHTWFPFHFDRLRKSQWWRRASDMARARNVMLWGEAFKNVPAGSLPDDDDELAEAAGFGMNTDDFMRAKSEIMAPWTFCSDGRWYHPTLCEFAEEAWGRMGEKRRADRVRKQNQRARMRKRAEVTANSPPVTRDTPEKPRDMTTQEKTGQENKITVGSASLLPTKSKPAERNQAFDELWSLATDLMRRRSSRRKAEPAFIAACRSAEPAKLVDALRAYVAGDEDVKRTGGPGLHRWLQDARWEAWIASAPSLQQRTDDQWRACVMLHRQTGRWSDDLGPRPGQPGCLVPEAILIGAAA